MEEFDRLVEIMAVLRSPDGCPWDREQTIDSLKPFVLEETYEVLEAIDRHDHAALCEELGDFLFEAVFLAQLESEAGHFTIADSVKRIADKLVRRHPHVFARDESTAGIDSPDKVVTRWEEIKAQERGGAKNKKMLLGGIPVTMPALLRAYEIGRLRLDERRGRARQDPGGGRRTPRGRRAARDRCRTFEGADGRRDGRPALHDGPPVASAGDRARDGAAQSERQVHETIHRDGNGNRIIRPENVGHEPR